ncbi:MAG: hypothetical protein M4579_003817 [Chaenotheca gracillima]|nr:MAG: hypothetical protein M4579_003817 [Chaenotheca gracillima]
MEHEPMKIPNRAIDTVRPLKVICAGAGISGILTAIRLPQHVQKLSLTIYDKNKDLGGTWFENKYPGVACDIPAHCYQLSFESNKEWSEFYASGPEILDYWRSVGKKYGVRKYMQLEREVLEARWHDDEAKWTVKIRNVQTGEVFEDSADVFISAIGILNKWKWPNVPGLHDFGGDLVHSAAWDTNFDYKGKDIALIGAGSTGIQILPKIQPDVKHVDHYVRGSTWVATTIVGEEVQKRVPDGSNFQYTKEEIEEWKRNPEAYLKYRKAIEQSLQSAHKITFRDSDAQKGARQFFTQMMQEKLKSKPEVSKHMLPDFPPLCKRLTPGPGYLESLIKDNVEVVIDPMEKVTREGIQTRDGKLRKVDAIICATGFDTTFTNRFPTYGKGGVKLGDKWKGFPSTYIGITTDEFPNYFVFAGPNQAMGAGNLLILFERIAEYTAKALSKMQTQQIRTMVPKARSVSNFTRFCESYFANTVFSLECSSWYKANSKTGKVSALWPGSSLHAIKVMDNPRWEDFEYTYVDGEDFGWFGDGWAEGDREEVDRAYYLDPENMDIPPGVTSGTVDPVYQSTHVNGVNGLNGTNGTNAVNGVK